MFLIVLALAVLPLVYSAALYPGAAGPRAGACAFTYDNRFYILGGNKSVVSPFMYTTFPLQLGTQSTLNWGTLSVDELFADMWSKDITTQNSYLRPCVVTPNGTLLVGGNSFDAYDLYHDRWLGTLNMTGTNPSALISCSYSTTCSQRVITVEDSLWIFQDVTDLSQPSPSNIYILNLTTYNWSTRQVSTNGAAGLPPNMKRPSLAYISAAQLANVTNTTTSGVIFLIGGDDSGSVVNGTTATSSIWIFDIASSLWYLAASNLTEPRSDCTTFFYPPRNQLFVFPGAVNGTSTGMTNVLEVLDLKNDPSKSLGIGISVIENSQTGLANQPPPLWDPNYVQQGNSIILYGGWYGGNSTINSDLFFIYDMAQSQWTTNATTTIFVAPTETPTQSSSAVGGQQSNVGPIVGGVVGGLAFCALVALAAICFFRRRARNVNGSTENYTADHYRYPPPHTLEEENQSPHTPIPDKFLLKEMGDIAYEKPDEVDGKVKGEVEESDQ